MVSYIEYEELEASPLEFQEISEELHSSDWNAAFAGLTALRSFAKFRWEEFIVEIPSVVPKLIELTDSPRSNLSKNALYLISECFLPDRPESESLAEPFLSTILVKSVNEKSFIKAVARSALLNYSTNCVSPSTTELLASFCFNKSGNICDLAFGYLKPMLNSIPPEPAIHISLKLLDSKRAVVLRTIQEFLEDLKTSWSEYDRYLLSLSEDDKNKIGQSSKTPTKKKESSFRDFILQKKNNLSAKE